MNKVLEVYDDCNGFFVRFNKIIIYGEMGYFNETF